MGVTRLNNPRLVNSVNAKYTVELKSVETSSGYPDFHVFLWTDYPACKNGERILFGSGSLQKSKVVNGAVSHLWTLPTMGNFEWKKYSKSYTVAASSMVGPVDIDVSRSGYKNLGIVGFSTNHGAVYPQQVNRLSDNVVRCYLWNRTSVSVTANMTVDMLQMLNTS